MGKVKSITMIIISEIIGRKKSEENEPGNDSFNLFNITIIYSFIELYRKVHSQSDHSDKR